MNSIANTQPDRPYHHGNLATSLVDAAEEILAERGVEGFTLADATRRVGVTASAPYAHFRGRNDLLAAVAVRGLDSFRAELEEAPTPSDDPVGALVFAARAYVRFAHDRRGCFTLLFSGHLDKSRYPEIHATERPIAAFYDDCVRALGTSAPDLVALAVEAVAHGHAMLLLDGSAGDVERVTASADRATRALLASRRHLEPERSG